MLNFKINIDAQGQKYMTTSLSGKALLTIPQLNKGTAFNETERKTFELSGKLPTHIETIEQQAARAYAQYQSYTSPLQKNIFLNKLHDTNQTLFYKLVENNEKEIIPIVYTPTRGLYISYEDRHQIEEILDNRSNPEVDLMVVSDGGGVLGIGDQGIGAMLIPVAKLMVYTICGGVNPLRTLPILLDVGTDNELLRNDPFYLGWRHPRIQGKDYDDFIQRFVHAIKKKMPNAFIQWEDFGRDNARRILQKYRTQICSFNDDIQGTGASALAALLAAVKSLGSQLTEQRILIFGAGNAGTGIADQICEALIRSGLTPEEARSHFWLIDKTGLLVEHSDTPLTAEQKPYARNLSEISQWKNFASDITAIIHHVKPTVLIGCSAQSGAFTRDAVIAMASHVEHPIIFPLSNPTEKAEATPLNLMVWTHGKALVATGSPFAHVLFEGTEHQIAQCNNALIFPGIGLGVIASKAQQVTDNMLWAACMALNQCAPIHHDRTSPLLPNITNAKATSRRIAIAVAEQAREDGVTSLDHSVDIARLIDENTWKPEYLPMQKI